MDPDFGRLAKNLARQIWDLRTKRKLTQSNLARRAGIPRSTLANLESGAGNPSLLNLSRVCHALDVPFEELLATPRPPVKLVRSAQVPLNSRAGGAVTVRKLLPDPVAGMAIDRLELRPGGRFKGVPHSAGTKEFVHCVSGELTVRVAGETYLLDEGDVLAFPGDAAHGYANDGAAHVLAISVVVLAPGG